MNFLIDLTKFNNPYFYLELGVSILVAVLIILALLRFLKRRFILAFYIVTYLGLLAAYIFEFNLLLAIFIMLITTGTIAFVVVNMAEFRYLIANQLKGKTTGLLGLRQGSQLKVKKIFDRDALFHEIEVAIESLSRNRVGALMTFEKKNPLSEVIKNGTVINAPVSSELLITIFYPGTRLHDGAVVIRDNIITAASVYYTPTTKPLNGKYGSRHRAAIGISELTDSVTVVVSEETGRISIACGGELESVSVDNFMRVFKEYMDETFDKTL